MLNFIIGKSGSGKTHRCYEILAEKTERMPVLVVPEQFEFETEKSIYKSIGAEKFNCIEITTFTKISEKIINTYTREKGIADDVSKQLIMYKTLREVKPSLVFYSMLAEKPSFAAMMLNAVAMMKSGGISPQGLDMILGGEHEFSENLNLKLLDLLTIYTAYNANLDKSFSDRLDNVSKAAQLARENNYFQNRTVFFDGFDSFSGSQLLLIQPIITQAENMYLTLCADAEKDNELLFGLSEKLMSRLSEYACENNVEFKKIACIGTKRYTNNELELLAEKLYQCETETEQPSGNATIVKASDLYAEAEYVCAEIRHLIMEKGYSYNDILIMTTDNDKYFSPLDSTFEKYEIPAFIDVPESILHKPLVNLVMSILNAVEDFSTESILRLTKTGFVRLKTEDGRTLPLTFKQINAFELFVYKWEVKGSDWEQPFSDNSAPDAEDIRSKLIPPLSDLRNRMRNATGSEITKELCKYLFDVLDIKSSILAHCKEVGNESLNLDKKLSEEYRQLWSIILRIFEAAYNCFSDYKINISDYIKLMREIFRVTNIAKPPQVMDSIMVGSIGRSRTADVKAVFLMGVNEGRFPPTADNGNFFTARETEEIALHGIDIAASRADSYVQKRFTAYKAFTVPSERLYITYPLSDTNGEILSPSSAISDICHLIEPLNAVSADTLGEEFYCVTPRAAQQRLARLYRHEGTPMRAELISALSGSSDNEKLITKLDRILRRSMGNGYKHRLTSANAKRIFRTRRISASKVDDISNCRFKYFCQYGLAFKEPEQAKLNPLNIGNIVHYTLQSVLNEYMGNKELFVKADEQTLNDKVHKYLDIYRNDKLLGDFLKTKRFLYLYENISRMVMSVLSQLQREFSISEFTPKYFEINISDRKTEGEKTIPPYVINVRDVGEVKITGKIDRVDYLEVDDKKYVRVIDYKTGTQSFDLYKVFYGLDTQMLMYLKAFCDSEDNLSEGGIAYFPAQSDKVVSDKRDAPETNRDKIIIKSHKMSGVFLNSNDVAEDYNKLESALKQALGGGQNKPLACEQISEVQFKKLMSHLEANLSSKLSGMYKGKLDAVPLCDKNTSPCTYCAFNYICGNETKKPSKLIDKTKAYRLLSKEAKKS